MTDQVTGNSNNAADEYFEPITCSVRRFSPCSNSEHRKHRASCLCELSKGTAGIHERRYGSCMQLPGSADHYESPSKTKCDIQERQQDNLIISPRLNWYVNQASYLTQLDCDNRADARRILRRASDPLLKNKYQRRSSMRPLSFLARHESSHIKTKHISMDGTSPQWPIASIKSPTADAATTHAAVHAETTGRPDRALASPPREIPASRSSVQVVESNNSVYEVIWDEKDYSESDATGSESSTATSSGNSSPGDAAAEPPFDRSKFGKINCKLAAWAWDPETGELTREPTAKSLPTTATSLSDISTDLVRDGPTPTGNEPSRFWGANQDTPEAQRPERPARSGLSDAESPKYAIYEPSAHPERVLSNLAIADTRFTSHRDSVAVTRGKMKHKGGMDMSRHRDSISVARARAQNRLKAVSSAVDIHSPLSQSSQMLPSILASSPPVEGAGRSDSSSNVHPSESPSQSHAGKHIRIAEGKVRRRD